MGMAGDGIVWCGKLFGERSQYLVEDPSARWFRCVVLCCKFWWVRSAAKAGGAPAGTPSPTGWAVGRPLSSFFGLQKRHQGFNASPAVGSGGVDEVVDVDIEIIDLYQHSSTKHYSGLVAELVDTVL